MWADTLLMLERGHLLRLLSWGALSATSGTVLLAYLTWRHDRAVILRHFALQTAAWGVVIAALAFLSWRDLGLRDFAGVQRLVNVLWLNVGLAVGYAAVGATMVLLSWRPARREAIMGAGLGIIVQGLALLLFDLRLIGAIGPMR